MPNTPERLSTIASALRADDPASAERLALDLLRTDPRSADAHRLLGDALWALGRLDESESSYRTSLRFAPDEPTTLANLALALSESGRVDEALTFYDRALQIDPFDRQARHNRSLCLLLKGDYARGWTEYESRWGSPSLPQRPFPRPLWDGSPLAGRTILLHAEQGLGDTIQFLRYVPLVRDRGGRIILVVQPALRQLLAPTPGVAVLIAQGDPIPPFDVHAPLLSLPRIFNTRLDSIPSNVPYLAPNPSRLAHWKREIAAIGGFPIGIAWQGNPRYRRDRDRSFPLSLFAPLAALPGVTLIGLQVGDGRDQIAANQDRVPLVDLGDRIDREAPFLDTAAILTCLELVITPDTILAHLAGALGVPTWIPVPRSPHWTWLLDRPDSPWYPTVRLFRQPVRGDWNSVFAAITESFRSIPSRPIRVEISPGELFDKISILRIKASRITDPGRLQNVLLELAELERACDNTLRIPPDLKVVLHELDSVNLAIWEVEDALRLAEHRQDFGPQFVNLARSVYKNNDRRALLKRKLNEQFQSRLIEEKSYQTSVSGNF